MKVLVTGATGFIGRRLCLALAQQGWQVYALCRNPHHPFLISHPGIIPVKGDITDRNSLEAAMQQCAQVYHTAALAKMWCRDRNDFYRVNVEGTNNVMEIAKQKGVQKIVHTSTCGVIGPTFKSPMTENDPRITGFPIDYERTKYLAELAVNEYVKQGMDIVMVNPSRVYGEGPITGSNTVGKMVSSYLIGKWHIVPGDGSQVSNYVYVNDVVYGHIAAMEKGAAGSRYILGGEDISFDYFFQELQSLSGKTYRLHRVPQKLIRLYSRLEKFKATLTGMPPVFLPEFAERLNFHQKYSSNKAVQELGYTITPFKEGLEKTIRYFQMQNT